ncbi:hypothetical protein [Paracoccus sp. PAR01]|uniref:hypothetical protein n=1 Tax=Paracoccus sp. PAR01 TaxID=2769282 RepID=UPI001781CA2C|nr:hypothetical protein [Paracoccus sp. PAR01]MBD9526215.1 hypothetical protein [Paracoccus sp. PAR01]
MNRPDPLAALAAEDLALPHLAEAVLAPVMDETILVRFHARAPRGGSSGCMDGSLTSTARRIGSRH